MEEDCFVDGEVCLVLQKRRLPDQPLEYLVKFRCEIKSGVKYRERWISADKLCKEFAIGAALIKQFEASKVGELAVDTQLSKLRSLPSPISRSEKQNHEDAGVNVAPKQQTADKQLSGKAPKRRCCDSVGRSASCTCCGSITPKSFKACNLSTSQSSSTGFSAHKPASFYSSASPVLQHKHFAKRLLLSDGVPRRDWSAKNSAKNAKLPNLVHPKPAERKSVVTIEINDGDSDADVRYSLVTDYGDSSDSDVQLTSVVERKRKTLSPVDDVKKEKNGTPDYSSSKVNAEVRLKTSPTNYNAEVCLKDCSTSAIGAATPSSRKRLKPNVSGNGDGSIVVLHNGNGQHPKPSPALPSSSAGSCQKVGHGSSIGDCKTDSFHRTSVTAKPCIFSSVKKPERLRYEVKLPENFHDDSSSDSSVTVLSEGRRISVRQTELVYRFKEIVVRKMRGYVHVSLVPHTQARNAVNPKVFQELMDAFHNARCDDSRVLLLSGSGNVFCSGVDLNYLLTECSDRREAAKTMADCLRDFVNTLITFPKPIVAAVNGPAVGLGMAILALCDVVYASDKASFSCPYTRLRQTPEACASYTLPKILGSAMANEMVLCGRKITALQACQAGLLSQVFWPTNMMQEVTLRVQNLTAQSTKVLEATKSLIRGHHRQRKLEMVNATECQLLSERWASAECQLAMRQHVDSVSDQL